MLSISSFVREVIQHTPDKQSPIIGIRKRGNTMYFEKRFSKTAHWVLKLNIVLSAIAAVNFLALFFAYGHFQSAEFLATHDAHAIRTLMQDSLLFRYLYTQAEPVWLGFFFMAIVSIVLVIYYARINTPAAGIFAIYTCLASSLIGGIILFYCFATMKMEDLTNENLQFQDLDGASNDHRMDFMRSLRRMERG